MQNRKQPVLLLDQQEQSFVGGVALSPDERVLAISNESGVWLRDSQTGVLLATLDGSTAIAPNNYQPRTFIAFSADGKRILSARCSHYGAADDQGHPACLETKVSLWDVPSKRLLSSYSIAGTASIIAFSADGQRLVSSAGTNVRLWNATTGQPLGSSFVCNTEAITSVVLSRDGTLLACGSSASIQLWNVTSGQPAGPPLILQNSGITGLAFSPDGHTLAASSSDKTVQLWEVTSGQRITTLIGDGQEKWSVLFSPDGTTLLSGSDDGTLLLWNTTVESAISQRLAHTGFLRSPVFSPDGTKVFTGSTTGKVLLYDVKTGQLVDTLDTAGYALLARDTTKIRDNLHAIQSLALSKDGKMLVAGRLDGTIIVWNMVTRQSFTFAHPDLVYRVALSADGQVLAVSGGGDTITLWNVAKRARIQELPYRVADPFSRLPIALSQDGKRLAVGGCSKVITDTSCQQGQVQLWDVATGHLIGQPLLGHQFAVSALAFSPDGGTLASSSQDANIILWNLSTGSRRVLTLPTDAADDFSNLLFSPKGTMLVSYPALSSNFSFVVWDVGGQELLAHAIHVEDAIYGSLAFSPDEQRLGSVSLLLSSPGRGVLTLWDIAPRLWQEHACAIANRDLTQDEWRQFVKDEERQSRVCPDLAM
jgi:WD40 repeat protein